MQRLGGLLLMLAGASLGAYSLIPPPHDGEEKLREVTRISSAPDRAVRPSAPVPRTAVAPSDSSAPAVIDAAPQKASELAAAMPVRPSSTWSAVVSSEPAAQQGRMTSSKPGDGEARVQLTRDLQRELQRVGCYEGEVTGNWTPSTKRALSTFMDRVNATLPMDEPDYILLTLVQGHTAAACGTDCPSGQAISENGRCVPNAIVAGATRKTQRDEQRRASGEQQIASQERIADEQRVATAARAVGARAVEAKSVQEMKRVATERRLADEKRAIEQRAAELKAKAKAELAAAEIVRREQSAEVSRQIVAEAGPEQLPWLKDDQLQLQSAKAARPKRPDGMMSVGGPQIAKAELTDSALAVTPDAGPVPIELDATDDLAAPDNSAAPVLNAPAPIEAESPENTSQQGYSGTKSGPAAMRGRPGTKSGVAVRGLTGSKSGLAAQRRAVQRFAPAARGYKPRVVAKRRALPAYAYRAPNSKYYYFAYNGGGKPKKSKSYKPHYNMMQALSGGFY